MVLSPVTTHNIILTRNVTLINTKYHSEGIFGSLRYLTANNFFINKSRLVRYLVMDNYFVGVL